MTKVRIGLVVSFVVGAWFAPGVALAQDDASGFAVNRFDPSERGSEWFVSESLDLRGSGRFAAGAVVDFAHRPLVFYENGEEGEALIENQLFGHFGAMVVLWDRVRFAVNLPIALYQNGNDEVVGGTTFGSDDATTLGDLRLGADVRIVGEYRSPFELAGGLQVHLPTGSEDSFTSDGTARLSVRGLVSGEIGPFVYASRLQLQLRPDDGGYAGNPLGTEMFGALAAGARLGPFVLGPELFTSTVVSDADAIFEETSTPFELIFGGHARAGDALFGVGVGPGLTQGLGTPAYRVLASVEWAPLPDPVPEPTPAPPPPADRDRDGIVDSSDACPDEAGVANDEATKNGCPVRDRDGDRVPDDADACPDVPGKASDDPKKNGCPDGDADGILDAVDACPTEAGVPSDDPKKHGCPPPKDTDGDGVFDPDDACPKEPGPRSNDPKTNGCPLAHIEADEIKILEPVKFALGSDKILPEGEVILDAVRTVLVAHPEIGAIEVRGHTDSKGADAANLRLSKRRAAAVKKWLVEHGIDASRVGSEGFGETLPIDTNDTEEGRRNNRRVEFRIVR